MKNAGLLLLQGLIVILGVAALAFLLWEPHIEGRNAHATVFEIYFKDPFLAFVYVGSIPFFVGLYRAFTLLGRVRQTGAFSQATVDALRAIQRCAFVLLGFVAVGFVVILLFGDPDDRPAGVFMGLLITLATSSVAFLAALFARKLGRALLRPEGLRG